MVFLVVSHVTSQKGQFPDHADEDRRCRSQRMILQVKVADLLTILLPFPLIQAWTIEHALVVIPVK